MAFGKCALQVPGSLLKIVLSYCFDMDDPHVYNEKGCHICMGVVCRGGCMGDPYTAKF